MNYFKEEVNEITNINLIDTALGLGLLAQDETSSNGKTIAHGIYGDVTWNINDALSVIGGIRWSQDKKDWCITGKGEVGFIAIPTVGPICGERKWTEVTPRIVTTYQINEEVMVYGLSLIHI